MNGSLYNRLSEWTREKKKREMDKQLIRPILLFRENHLFDGSTDENAAVSPSLIVDLCDFFSQTDQLSFLSEKMVMWMWKYWFPYILQGFQTISKNTSIRPLTPLLTPQTSQEEQRWILSIDVANLMRMLNSGKENGQLNETLFRLEQLFYQRGLKEQQNLQSSSKDCQWIRIVFVEYSLAEVLDYSRDQKRKKKLDINTRRGTLSLTIPLPWEILYHPDGIALKVDTSFKECWGYFRAAAGGLFGILRHSSTTPSGAYLVTEVRTNSNCVSVKAPWSDGPHFCLPTQGRKRRVVYVPFGGVFRNLLGMYVITILETAILTDAAMISAMTSAEASFYEDVKPDREEEIVEFWGKCRKLS